MNVFQFIATYNIELDNDIAMIPEHLLDDWLRLFNSTRDEIELQPINGAYPFEITKLIQ